MTQFPWHPHGPEYDSPNRLPPHLVFPEPARPRGRPARRWSVRVRAFLRPGLDRLRAFLRRRFAAVPAPWRHP